MARHRSPARAARRQPVADVACSTTLRRRHPGQRSLPKLCAATSGSTWCARSRRSARSSMASRWPMRGQHDCTLCHARIAIGVHQPGANRVNSMPAWLVGPQPRAANRPGTISTWASSYRRSVGVELPARSAASQRSAAGAYSSMPGVDGADILEERSASWPGQLAPNRSRRSRACAGRAVAEQRDPPASGVLGRAVAGPRGAWWQPPVGQPGGVAMEVKASLRATGHGQTRTPGGE